MTSVPPASGLLNDPPMQGPPPGMPLPGEPGFDPRDLFPNMTGPPAAPSEATTADVAGAIAKATKTQAPTLDERGSMTTDLPGGYLVDGHLYRTARVKELNGYAEEALARLDLLKNVGVYVTELLMLGIEELGGEAPTRDAVRSLLIGDRDALIIGVRKATYGDKVEFTLDCASCGNKSEIEVLLDEDVKTTVMEDPMVRTFTVPLRNGEAKVTLLTGVAQEAFSEDVGRKTKAEIDTIMLAKSIIEINGVPVRQKEEPVKALSAADRSTLIEFISDRQCGPQFNEIPVACATCGAEYPISLGLPSLFRL